ncbi:MAG: hypothetical protein AVDCRST_MAG05-1776 [uncultured Rubrobacteraceae bacterium]|uniref:Uncharacterized protein n=1 Tax=uncultured Rubrobacteraceae bacterium TaxID=349277 RepID=A0A6J4S5G3_9ACTN|nr:MAG: hypothetical protein AVDCRST_MAG05-1776 [uncultured Rubrobacteraceae bacterium]
MIRVVSRLGYAVRGDGPRKVGRAGRRFSALGKGAARSNQRIAGRPPHKGR